uniref:Testis associated actin remodelling kinase 1 n=1 Tax=Neolamprologus brichardi TaxID=32507 RepID=A0A3Q4GB08_NEOBR
EIERDAAQQQQQQPAQFRERARPSSYRALRSAVSTLARLDDFSREKIVTAFFSVQHRVSGQVMALKMNILASNRANMLREVQLMNRLSHPNILRLVHLEVLLLFSFLFSCSEEEGQEPLAVVGSPYWMAPEVLRGEVYNEKVDVFAYGIILCEIIARIQADPDILPRTEDFGLDVEAFRHMVADCPSHFLNLAIACCNMNAKLRPSFSQIVAELEKKQAERKQKAEPAVKATSPPVSPVRRRSLGLLLDQRLSRSKSDMLHPSETPPTATLAPPARFNPFSQREDLKGGKIKLFDTPSKSVISLTFTLPPPPDCDDTTASDADAVDMPRRHRRCHSLPCTPPPHLTSAPNTVLSEDQRKKGWLKTFAESALHDITYLNGMHIWLNYIICNFKVNSKCNTYLFFNFGVTIAGTRGRMCHGASGSHPETVTSLWSSQTLSSTT